MKFNTRIGLEIHARITATKNKLFSGGINEDSGEPNTQVDLLDIGAPGALPVLNKYAVFHAIRACIALNMNVNEKFSFDRKNYFYPDLALGYQITQFYKPIGINGELFVSTKESKKKIRIKQLHMETDVGKGIHKDHYTYLDFNRSGCPLMEIVTEPDMVNPNEVIFFIKMLKATSEYVGVCDGNMELGNLRVDVNISVSKDSTLGNRVEIKNLNSYRAIRKAIEFEQKRQIELVLKNEEVQQETRLFDEKTSQTVFMRRKENPRDYMYFKDPDLPEFLVDDGIIVQERERILDLPEKVFKEWTKKFALQDSEIMSLLEDHKIFLFLNKAFRGTSLIQQKQMLKLTLGEVFARLKNEKDPSSEKNNNELPIDYRNFRKLATIILRENLNSILIKEILDKMWINNDDPEEIINKYNIKQVSNDKDIIVGINFVLKNNEKEVERYVAGEDKLKGFLVGQVMKKFQNRADPQLINRLIDKILNELKSKVN